MFNTEKMMKRLTLCLVLSLVVALAGPAYAQLGGNGMPSGSHYNLNLLGKDHCPGDDMKGGNRHTIFVKLRFTDADADNILGDDPGNAATLDRTNKIFLYPGDFQVLDGNACDGDGAGFRLPANGTPAPGDYGVIGTADDVLVGAAYEIYLRELGKPGGSGDIRTCGIDEGPDGVANTSDDEVVCSSENVIMFRDKGQPKARNVTMELTTLVLSVDLDGDTIFETVRIPIFDPLLFQYFWDYDNNGLRLVQLRFYPLN